MKMVLKPPTQFSQLIIHTPRPVKLTEHDRISYTTVFLQNCNCWSPPGLAVNYMKSHTSDSSRDAPFLKAEYKRWANRAKKSSFP